MGVSIWFLYIGIFLCASGIGLVVGLIFIAYWGIKTLEEAKQGNSYTENNFTANIDHYHADNSGDNGDTGATVNGECAKRVYLKGHIGGQPMTSIRNNAFRRKLSNYFLYNTKKLLTVRGIQIVS